MYCIGAGKESPACYFRDPRCLFLSIFEVYVDCQPTSNSVIYAAMK